MDTARTIIARLFPQRSPARALTIAEAVRYGWMSWNAAKRILSYGYSNVAWYPEGTEGWERANLPVVDSRPLSRAEEGNPSSR
jgi:hypothetical protein